MTKNTDTFRLYRIILRIWKNIRDRFAASLEADDDRKATIYIDLANSTTLKDVLYWVQIFFSAGIATLGLVLNSPAVVIGAMLISPLMGPILSAGLALATGDLILGIRAAVNLVIGTFGAIFFAMILVAFLPFKEASSEILARTSPNTLDLGIALFSGIVGSVAICKEVKGVVTSIPGVAIAVALMPPLCVVGFGMGLALSFDSSGYAIAAGGGLLYLTNLVAITFTAMMVFYALRIDTVRVRERVKEWRANDPESVFWKKVISKIPALNKAREIRSVSLRLVMILLPLLLIIIPLTKSYSQLRIQYQQKQNQNKIAQTVKDVWSKPEYKVQEGAIDRTLDEVRVKTDGNNKSEIYMRVIDQVAYTQEQRDNLLSDIARELNRREDSIVLQLVELRSSYKDSFTPQAESTPPPPTILEMRTQYLQGIKNAMTGLNLPPPAKLLDYRINNSVNDSPSFQLYYFSDRDIDVDAQNLLVISIRNRLSLPDVRVTFERVPVEANEIKFVKDKAEFDYEGENPLSFVGPILQRYPGLVLEVSLDRKVAEELYDKRVNAIRGYLNQNWSVPEQRIVLHKSENPDNQTNTYKVVMPE